MCYKIVFGIADVKFDDFFNAVLLLQHVVMLSSCSKNIVLTTLDKRFSANA